MQPGAEENDARLPRTESWSVGRRWFGVLAAVVAAANAVAVVLDLGTGEVETTGDVVFAVVRIVLVGTFAFQALYELRSRVIVDGDGAHHQELRRRTYRWEEIAEVRLYSRWGENVVQLVRHDGDPVPLPRSTEHLDVLRRRHASATRPTDG
ncbi:PH domain-containing protein [Georgenia satyanarayanai]|uniref:PH domain-containing protein n=1 Tax=Georgenia satyanarayanai TaxID=860221 RepID=UPI0012654993|nr:PH domain-containing protein [Georgenia satyanarayanai]